MEQVAPFVKSLPYAPEMRTVHAGVSQMYFRRKREAELASWSAWREEMMTRHRDRWALGEVFQSRGITRHLQGDYAAALACFAAANQAFREVGDPVRTDRYTQERGSLALMLGDLATAQSCFEQLLPAAVARGTYLWLVPLLMGLGIVHTASGDWPRATTSFTHPVPQDQHPRQANIWLARVLVAQGDRAAAVAHLARALAIMEAGDLAPRMRSCYVLFGRPVLVDALSALDVALDDSAAFAAYCRDYQAARPELARGPFKHWTLRPAVPDPAFPGADPAALPAPCDLSADGWTWYDPMEDCAYQMQGGGLILNAANGRDLWYMNRTAPRLRRPAQGDFAIQTVCRPAQADRPGLGGLLLWRGGENYLRLGIGIRGQDEVSLEGCLDNHDWVFGRGRLSAGRVWLRLERVGTRVRGLCRGDDGPWYLVGETAFPADGPVQVGLHAIGEIDRTVYHSAYPAGTALACDGLWLWP